jgi:hypothetical protein
MARRVESLMLNCTSVESDSALWRSVLAVLEKEAAAKNVALIPQGTVFITQYKEESTPTAGEK